MHVHTRTHARTVVPPVGDGAGDGAEEDVLGHEGGPEHGDEEEEDGQGGDARLEDRHVLAEALGGGADGAVGVDGAVAGVGGCVFVCVRVCWGPGMRLDGVGDELVGGSENRPISPDVSHPVASGPRTHARTHRGRRGSP